MCKAEGIQSAVVGGYIKDFDFFDGDTLYRAEHAWSAVNLNGQWQLMDVTWGSGYLTYRSQYLAKLMWKWFEVPYRLKIKYVHKYNPDWFYVNPDEMIYTHLPIMEMYQLLSNPVKQGLFEQGDSALTVFLSNETHVVHASGAISKHLSLPKAKQFQIEAEQGFRDNPNNHRVKGFNYYLAVNEYFGEYFKETYKLIQTNDSNLNLMENYCSISDSLMRLSILDNQFEFNQIVRRSNQWKNDVQSANNALKNSMKVRVSLNKKQMRLMDKTRDKNASIKRYAKKNPEVKEVELKGPRKPEYVNQIKSKQLLERADSLHREAMVVLEMKDSLLSVYSESDQYNLIEREEFNRAVFEFNNGDIESELYYRLVFVPQIYFPNEEIKKKDVISNHMVADSVNKAFTNRVLIGLYTNQNLAKVKMKEYQKLMKMALKDLKSAKKLSESNQNEQSLHNAYTVELNLSFENYENQMSSYLYFQKEIRALLKQEIRVLTTGKTVLTKQNWYENHRHRNYTAHRRSIQKNEDKVAKAVIKQVGKMNKYVLATKQYRLDFKEDKVSVKK